VSPSGSLTVPAIVVNPTGTTPGVDVGAASADGCVTGVVGDGVSGDDDGSGEGDVTGAAEDVDGAPGDDGAGADTDSAQAASTSSAALASRLRTTGTVRP
jgi:hypothetical protein